MPIEPRPIELKDSISKFIAKWLIHLVFVFKTSLGSYFAYVYVKACKHYIYECLRGEVVSRKWSKLSVYGLGFAHGMKNGSSWRSLPRVQT